MNIERPTVVAKLGPGPIECRLERRDGGVVIMLQGGHMRAGIALGEEVFAELGLTVLAPSRPGYGATPLSTGTSPKGFADALAALCEHLEIEQVEAVVGVSGGGPTAVTMAARHPRLVRRLLLESAVGTLPWPDRRTRVLSELAFAPRVEPATWGVLRLLMRHAPGPGLRLLLRDLTSLPPKQALAGLRPEQRALLIDLFGRMRSGAGFLNDVRQGAVAPEVAGRVAVPTLVIASPNDGVVPFAQSQALAATIPGAELIAAGSDTHFIWFGPDYTEISDQIRRFLTTPT